MTIIFMVKINMQNIVGIVLGFCHYSLRIAYLAKKKKKCGRGGGGLEISPRRLIVVCSLRQAGEDHCRNS